jgi:hypothetical protein
VLVGPQGPSTTSPITTTLDQGNRPGCSRVRPGVPNVTVEASGNQRIGATAVEHTVRADIIPSGTFPDCEFHGAREEPATEYLITMTTAGH